MTEITAPGGYVAPVVYLPGDVRDNSRAYGLPVVTEDGYNHAPECYWCDGNANPDTCPRSVALNAYVERFRAGAAPAAPAGGAQ